MIWFKASSCEASISAGVKPFYTENNTLLVLLTEHHVTERKTEQHRGKYAIFLLVACDSEYGVK